MKNSLKTLVVSAMTAIVLSATVFSSIAAETVVPTEKIPARVAIKKVVVKGNTKVLLVQSNNDQVSIEEGRMDKVSVEQMGDVLTVSSKEDVPVTVIIYVRNLYRISALNNADVRTDGKFSLPYLQLILRDYAAAHINAKTESIYTDMDGETDLYLAGTTEHHTIRNSGIGSLHMKKLAALKTENLSGESSLAMNTVK